MNTRTLVLAGTFGLAAAAAQAATITTEFANNASRDWDGAMFDVLVGGSNLTVDGFDLNLKVGDVGVAFYVHTDTHVGFTTNTPPSWSLVASGNVTSTGIGDPTHWDIPDFSLTAGQSYGFYLTTTTSNGNRMVYSLGSGVGSVMATNSDITLYEGGGSAYEFAGYVAGRVWNGTIHYTVEAAAVPLPATAPLLVAGLGLLGLMRRRARG